MGDPLFSALEGQEFDDLGSSCTDLPTRGGQPVSAPRGRHFREGQTMFKDMRELERLVVELTKTGRMREIEDAEGRIVPSEKRLCFFSRVK
jgi:hypothetical protein